MSSSDPSYQQLGLDAISTCFIPSSSGSMMMCSSEAPFFHPSIVVPHDASFLSGSGSGVGADVAAHYNYMANDAMETDEDAYAGAESCSTVHSMSMLPAFAAGPLGFFQYGGPADVTIAQPPSRMSKLITGEPHCNSWLYDGPSAVSIHEPYYLAPFSGAGSFPAASGLSLRLGAALSSSVTMASLPEQSSDVSCSGLTHANSEGFGYQQQPETTVKAHAESDDGMPMPFQLPPYPEMYSTPPQLSQVLPRSRYAHVAQELLNGFAACLLNDVADHNISDFGPGNGGIGSEASSNKLMLPSIEQRQDDVRGDLLRLLQLMDQRCNRCFDDIQATASRFSSMVAHSGGGGGGGAIVAAPRFAHRAVWATYQRLRKRITGMMVAVAQREQQPSSLADKERRWESSFIQKHWALQQLRRGDQQSWRPQRGLPEKSVAVLKAWMFENFLRPYPKDNEKDMLAARSGLSRSQVSNWFINARVRLWKPMIEEMYEELKRSSGGREVEHLSSKDVVC